MIVLYLAAAGATPAAESARQFVARVYAGYRREDYSPLDRPASIFAARLTAAIREDERLAKAEVGYLDGDPLCDCQDTGGMRSSIGSLAGSGNAATVHVLVRFEGTRDRRDIRLKLARTPAGWRIADVGTTDQPSLLGALEAANRKARARH